MFTKLLWKILSSTHVVRSSILVKKALPHDVLWKISSPLKILENISDE